MKRMTTYAFLWVTSIMLAIVFAGVAEGQIGNNVGVLNPNQAGEKELLALPHIDSKLTKGIMGKRPFYRFVYRNDLLKGLGRRLTKQLDNS